MDKRVIFATAGAGKTTYIVNSLSEKKRSLILTYTDGNYLNLERKISEKFNGKKPSNIVLMKYFYFLYHFCYKPFGADKVQAKGICFLDNQKKNIVKDSIAFYMTSNGYFYSNRLAFFLEECGFLPDIKKRLEKYFDEVVIDEVQDIAGRDFNFLEKIMDCNINMLFVGDFYQHTFDTSRDGNVNKSLFNNKTEYEMRFKNKGVLCDDSTLQGSWRCGHNICDFIKKQLGISIHSNRSSENDNSKIVVLNETSQVKKVLLDETIIKLHYKNASMHGGMHKNWGEVKGEDNYQDVCIILNQNTVNKMRKAQLQELAPTTKNKLYVAITRARGNVFLVSDSIQRPINVYPRLFE